MRARALEALGEYGGDEALPLLEAAFFDDNENSRAAAASALGKVGGERALDLLRTAQSDKDSWVRMCAGTALVEMGTEKAFALLEKSLREPGEEGARHVIERLAKKRSVNALLALVRILGMERLDWEEPPWQRELRRQLERNVTFELTETSIPEAVKFLQKLAGVTIIVHPRALEPDAGRPRRATARVENTTLARALRELLEPAGLAYTLRDEVIYVSTPEMLAKDTKDHHRARARALDALARYRGDFVRDEFITRAAVEPSVVLRSRMVELLRTGFPGDPAVREELRAQASPEAKAERARRREHIRAERIRRRATPLEAPDPPVDAEADAEDIF